MGGIFPILTSLLNISLIGKGSGYKGSWFLQWFLYDWILTRLSKELLVLKDIDYLVVGGIVYKNSNQQLLGYTWGLKSYCHWNSLDDLICIY